nr:hypothetical protein CFP56_72023 [Quercus suber]
MLLPIDFSSSNINENIPRQSESLSRYTQPALYDVLSTRSSDLQGTASFNATAVLAGQQGHTIAILTTVTSCVSFTATLFAIYWFCMMRRNFRRSLVALLIVADLVKSLCLLVQSSSSMSPGGLHTGSSLCQVTGYVFLASSESCGKYKGSQPPPGIEMLTYPDRYHRLPYEPTYGSSDLPIETARNFGA